MFLMSKILCYVLSLLHRHTHPPTYPDTHTQTHTHTQRRSDQSQLYRLFSFIFAFGVEDKVFYCASLESNQKTSEIRKLKRKKKGRKETCLQANKQTDKQR